MDGRMTPEVLVYDIPLVDDPQLSPDGRKLLYTLATVDRESGRRARTLWVSDSDGAKPTCLLPESTGANGGRWSPNGNRIAFVEQTREGSAIKIMPAGEGDSATVTFHRAPVSSLAWSPDGRQLAYVCRFDPANPDEHPTSPDDTPPVRVVRRLDYKDNARGYVNDVRNHIFAVDVATGARRRLTTEYIDHDRPAWSPDGRWIGANLPSLSGWGSSRLLLIDTGSSERRRVGYDSGVVHGWSWSPAGSEVLFTGDTNPTYQDDFFIYRLADDSIRRVTEELPCQPVGAPVWISPGIALFSAVRSGTSAFYHLDTESGAFRVIASIEGVFGEPHVAASSTAATMILTTFGHFREAAVIDLASHTVTFVTAYGETVLKQAPPAVVEPFEVRRDTLTIEGWLLKPSDFDESRQYPVILDVHGGPHSFHGYKFNWMAQCLASHGFLVIAANPRGSTSYGRAFTTAVLDDWMGEDYLDVMAVLDAVLERPYADRNRTGIYGYSYGGHMTAWAIGNTQRFKAAVCGAPSFDLETQYATSSGDYDYGDIAWGGPPWTNYMWYVGRSPSTYAHRARTPTLILHGEEDQDCPISQGEYLFTTLMKVGCPVEFARYPGANHSFIDPLSGEPRHQEDALARTLGWFQHYLVNDNDKGGMLNDTSA